MDVHGDGAMKCPKCGHEWTPRPETLAKELGAKGGAKSKRKITAEQQKKMQEARKRSWDQKQR